MTGETAREYLAGALDILAGNALNRDSVDWERLRAEAFAATATAAEPADTHPQIQRAVAMLGDPHTVFIPPEVATALSGEQADTEALMPTGRRSAEFGLIRLPEASGLDAADERYVRTGAELLAGLDATGPSGWIVDLRGNTGGNMFPMLTVVAPLLGDGHLGAFVDGRGVETARWHLAEGVVTVDGESQSPIPHPYRLTVADPYIAVLTDADCMSAGEATLIAFRGKPRVRTFGAATAGLATGNAAFALPDGAMLAVTVAREADRTGRGYGNEPIPPDEPAADAEAAAVAWLRTVTG